MRIIGGNKRGHKLYTPAGERVRPTADRVREALFNVLQTEVPGARVLDLFAGTGAIGLEALSRGAHSAVFVDNNSGSVKLIKQNVNHLGFNEKAAVIVCDARSYLEGVKNRPPQAFTIIYIDPPYGWNHTLELLDSVDAQVLDIEGVVVVEQAAGTKLPPRVGSLFQVSERSYGNTKLTFYRYFREEDQNAISCLSREL